MTKYFSKFPIIPYNNMFARNLLTRVQLTKETRNNETIFYPYTLKDEDKRLEVAAHKYYKDPDYEWLVMLTNNIIDPYYGAGLPTQELDLFIEAKYGSMGEAQAQIVYWRNDWLADDSRITPGAFSALPDICKKYYNHVTDYNGTVIGHERKQEDWIVATNKLVECVITPSTDFPVDTRFTQPSTESTAVVAYSSGTSLVLKHVDGPLTTGTLTGTTTITISSITNTTYALNSSEQGYWSPVSAYDYEQEKNKQARDIELLDRRLVYDVEKEITRLLDDLQN